MKKLLVTTICLLGAHLLSAGEIWISPQGNDLNDGTRPSPNDLYGRRYVCTL